MYGLPLVWLFIDVTSFRLAYFEGPVELFGIPPLFSFLSIIGFRSCCTAANRIKAKSQVSYLANSKVPRTNSRNIYNHFSFHKQGISANDNIGIDFDDVSSLHNSSDHDTDNLIAFESSVWRILCSPRTTLLHNDARMPDPHTRDTARCCLFAKFDHLLTICHPLFCLDSAISYDAAMKYKTNY